MADISEYISVAEFAERFKISEEAVRKAIRECRIRNVTKVGKLYAIHKSEILKWGNGHARM